MGSGKFNAFGIEGLLTVIAEFGTRSMNARAIQYPYWENVARGWEDVLAIVLILQIIFLMIPLVIIVTVLTIAWKRKQWTWKDVGHFFVKCWEKVSDKFHSEKTNGNIFNSRQPQWLSCKF